MYSLGKIVLIFISFQLVSCTIQTKRDIGEPDNNRYKVPIEEIQQEVSLKADREKFKNYREEVPQVTQKENDEMAFVLELFKDPSNKPNKIQSKFDRSIRSKESKFRKRTRKERSEFSKLERKKRDEFLKGLKKEREAFNSAKVTSEERKEFYSAQDEKRKEYFANERDRRKDFESQMRELQRDTSSNFRDLRSMFREEMRVFRNRHREWKRQKKKERKSMKSRSYNTRTRGRSAPKMDSSLMQDFNELDKVQAQPIGSDSN